MKLLGKDGILYILLAILIYFTFPIIAMFIVVGEFLWGKAKKLKKDLTNA